MLEAFIPWNLSFEQVNRHALQFFLFCFCARCISFLSALLSKCNSKQLYSSFWIFFSFFLFLPVKMETVEDFGTVGIK